MVPIFGQPWVIKAEWMKVVLAVASRDRFYGDLRKQALEARGGQPLENARRTTVRDGVAIIPVVGPLVRHASIFDDISGATSYADIRRDLQVALDDRKVTSILLSLHSPGGEVTGCNELADAIYGARAQKQINAYVDGMACSGGYWLASACDQVITAETGELGSIGVVLAWLDDSKALESVGVEEVQFVSWQSPFKRPDHSTDDGKAQYQRIVDDLGDVFVKRVARNRGVDETAVLEHFGQGGILIGAHAVEAGLADRIGNFEDLLAEMAGALPTTSSRATPAAATARERTMTIKTSSSNPTPPSAPTPPTPSATASGDKCDGCGNAMTPSKYCAQCFEGDDDEEDEEDCSALGLEPKTPRSARLKRATELVAIEKQIVSLAAGLEGDASAIDKVKAAIGELTALRGEVAGVKADAQRRQLRGVLEAALDNGTLSLGAIQKKLPSCLRGEQKKAWAGEMGKLKAVTRDSVLDAACAVPLSAEDVSAIGELVADGAPISAEVFKEPKRDAQKEAASVDATNRAIDNAVKKTKAVMDRPSKK
jgi:signal peptide peptidase SppA